jgi:membrane protease YdiL (CAAX protease family)
MEKRCNPSYIVPATSSLTELSAVAGSTEEHPIRLAVETLVVTIGAIAVVKLLSGHPFREQQWWLIPTVLVFSALVPTWVGKRDFARIGWDMDSIRRSLVMVAWVGGCASLVTFAGLWWMKQRHLSIPLDPVIGERPSWLGWLLYQFLYVAVAEEVFFRGYVQGNITRMLARTSQWSRTAQLFAPVVVSAACFAIAHAIVQENLTALLTFFPALIMAWMFLRTGSLLAPILFHGLANTAYGIAAAILS